MPNRTHRLRHHEDTIFPFLHLHRSPELWGVRDAYDLMPTNYRLYVDGGWFPAHWYGCSPEPSHSRLRPLFRGLRSAAAAFRRAMAEQLSAAWHYRAGTRH